MSDGRIDGFMMARGSTAVTVATLGNCVTLTIAERVGGTKELILPPDQVGRLVRLLRSAAKRAADANHMADGYPA